MNANRTKVVYRYQLTIVLCVLILSLLITACHSTSDNDNPQPEMIAVTDTVFASQVDSLEWVYATGTMADKMSACNDLARHYWKTNVSLSRQYAEDLLRMALQTKDKKREGNAYQRIFDVSQNDSAVFYADKALNIYEELKEDTLAVFLKLNKAIVLGQLYRNDEALEIMQECLDYYTQNNMEYRRGTTIQSMGAMYGDMQLHELANEYYSQALTIYETLDKDEGILRNMGFCYSNSGENFFRTNDYQKALEYSEKALELFRQINDVYYTVSELMVLSTRYLVLEKNEDAWRYLNETETLMENIDNDVLRSEVLKTRGYFHAWNDDYKQALDYTQQALALMDSTNKRAIYILYSLLAAYAPFAATPLETQTYIRQFSKAAQEAINEEWSQKLTEMEVKYETEKKQLEIERQQHIISRQNMQRWLLAGSVAVCVVFLALLWYMLRLRNRRNRALTEMNATKDRFFNIISHDLKNPAIALNDNLKLLVNNVRVWDAETLTDFSNELLKSTEGQVELLNSLLSWARIQTGRITCNPATFDLAAHLRSEIMLVHKMAENKGITLNFQMPDDAPVTGDSNMLVTVVRNLLTNAVKFTAPGGTVTLSVELNNNSRDGVRPISTKMTTTYIVSVSDTGTGMTSEQIENLFCLDKPQTHRGTAGEEGSGLGLIVCKELLDMHDSILHIESQEGKGSRFWFIV